MTVRRRHKDDEDADVNLTPMLDVTFILLIFFIVTSTFVKIPGAQIDKITTDNGAALKSPIIIAIDADSEIWIDRKKVLPREVYAMMQELIEDNPGAKAMIQVDGASKSGALMELMNSMTNAGMLKIDIITTPKASR